MGTKPGYGQQGLDSYGGGYQQQPPLVPGNYNPPVLPPNTGYGYPPYHQQGSYQNMPQYNYYPPPMSIPGQIDSKNIDKQN
jgi:hypothetical protein